MNLNRLLLLSCATGALIGMGGVALAQDSTSVDEIVVTATKRSESLQEVPVAVTAFTAAMREQTGIVTTQDQMNFTPGVTYSATADRVAIRGVGRQTNTVGTDPGVAVYQDGFYVPQLSGVGGSTLGVARVEVLRGPQGTLYGRNSIGGAINVIARRPSDETEREVRAGYDSYGRTTFEGRVAGALTDHVNGSFMATKIDQEDGYYENRLGGPDEGGVTDLLSGEGQLAIEFNDRFDMWMRFSGAGADNRDRSSTMVSPYDSRYSLGNIPNPTYDLAGRGFTNPGISDSRAFATNRPSSNYVDDYLTFVTEMNYHFDNVDLKYIGGWQQYETGYSIDGDRGPSYGFNWPLSNDWANQGLFYLVGFPLNPANDSGATVPFSGDIETAGTDDKDSWSHEINISSTGEGPFQWLFGLYYYQEQYTQNFRISFPSDPVFDTVYSLTTNPALLAALGAPDASLYGIGWLIATGNPAAAFLQSGIPNPTRDGARTLGALDTRSSAAFAQFDYDITDEWHATAGIRYSHDEKEGVERLRLPTYFPYLIPAGTPLDVTGDGVADFPAPADTIVSYVADVDPRAGTTNSLEDSWNHTTGTAGLQWTPSDDTLVYATYSHGYKSGGFNLGTFAAPVAPETIDAYEIGWKQSFGPTFQLNLAVFDYGYHGLQTTIQKPISASQALPALFNLNEARSRGAEVEAIWSPTDNFRLMANYSYLDATIESACCILDDADPDGTRHAGGTVPGAFFEQNLAGNRVPFSPEHKASVNATYTFNFEPGALSLSATENYRSESYYTVFNTPDYLMEGYETTDVRAMWRDANDRFTLIGSVQNVFDEEAVQSYSTSSPQTSNQITLGLQQPRIYSVELQYRF